MRTLFNLDWTFYKAKAGTTYDAICDMHDKFEAVSIPHDWAIEKFEYFYEDATGWYRKSCDFHLGENERIILYFDGIYMDSTVYVNGHVAYEWKYGYTQFEVDITPFVSDGANEICVSVNYYNPNSRWYSGAGITRNIWMEVVPNMYIPRYGIYAHADLIEDGNYMLTVDTEIATVNTSMSDEEVLSAIESISLTDSDGNIKELTPVVCDCDTEDFAEGEDDSITVIRNTFRVDAPKLWDIDEPNLYTIKVKLSNGYSDDTMFGFRTIKLTNNTGAYINGRHIKLNGVCEHHDFGMLGGLIYEDAMERKIINLKNMGVNSIRFAHNPVDPAVLALCDRMGILAMSEAFDMWENPKTQYDYARFFNEWHERDVRAWIRQDRNHPCILMWSIGNEIYDIHMGERGREIVNILSDLVKKYDYMHNGYITFCSNYMPWENAQKAANDIEVVGYNYAEKYYEEHHKKYSNWIIYGSETSSIAYSRGVYHFPRSVGNLSDDDSQCSAMGNSASSWGAKNIEECICYDRDTEYSLGQYIWSGHDYLGEPTPYHTKNSYLGIIDTAGYPKDPYYGWKSSFTQGDESVEPFIYVSPEWDYNEGQKIDVRVYSNVPTVELVLNGKSLGRQSLTHGANEGMNIIADYIVDYVPGELVAIGYDSKGIEVVRQVKHSFGDTTSVQCTRQQYSLSGCDYTLGQHRMYNTKLEFYDITALDANGYTVENASDYVTVSVSGGGRLLTLDNGDSTDYTDQASDTKRLFKGKLLAVVEVLNDEKIIVEASINKDTIPVRRIQLSSLDGNTFSENKRTITIQSNILPANASDKDVTYKIADCFGNVSNVAKITSIEGNNITVEAVGDGQFQLRAFSKSSTEDIRVISQLEFTAEGLGEAFYNPYTFVPGSCYTSYIGSVGAGNERGVATARDEETVIVYERVDFGRRGSDTMTLPIFVLGDNKVTVDIYDGVCGSDDAVCLCNGIYDRKMIWNVYQEETYKLSERLTGVHTISIRTTEKMHIKGFYCKEYNPAYDYMNAAYCENVYGDTYTIDGQFIREIGNNVTIDFGDIDFTEGSPTGVIMRGRARGNRNTIHIRFDGDNGEVRSICEYDPTDDYCEKTFTVTGMSGKGKIQLIFLPGCDFDFEWMKFIY